MWIALLGALIIEIVLICCISTARKVPLNYILLFSFTLLESYLVAYIASFYTVESVVIALGLTVALSLSLSIYAIKTSRDFTTMGAFLFACGMGVFFAGFIMIFITSRVVQVIYSLIICLLVSLYLIYDIQLLWGHKRYKLGSDDYIVGALIIYVDLITLFIEILSILG